MIVSVKKTVYPNGQEIEYTNGMKVEVGQAPDTKQFNRFHKEIFKSLKKQYKCNSRNQ